jgi:hypothetical protein
MLNGFMFEADISVIIGTLYVKGGYVGGRYVFCDNF